MFGGDGDDDPFLRPEPAQDLVVGGHRRPLAVLRPQRARRREQSGVVIEDRRVPSTITVRHAIGSSITSETAGPTLDVAKLRAIASDGHLEAPTGVMEPDRRRVRRASGPLATERIPVRGSARNCANCSGTCAGMDVLHYWLHRILAPRGLGGARGEHRGPPDCARERSDGGPYNHRDVRLRAPQPDAPRRLSRHADRSSASRSRSSRRSSRAGIGRSVFVALTFWLFTEHVPRLHPDRLRGWRLPASSRAATSGSRTRRNARRAGATDAAGLSTSDAPRSRRLPARHRMTDDARSRMNHARASRRGSAVERPSSERARPAMTSQRRDAAIVGTYEYPLRVAPGGSAMQIKARLDQGRAR